MSRSSVRVQSQKASKGSHCLVEWDEPGKPYSVVENKQVKGVEDVLIGDMCSVGLCRGVKSTYYDAKLLATGSKSEMEYELELFEEIRQVEDGNDSISDRSEYEESDEPKKKVRQPSKRGRKSCQSSGSDSSDDDKRPVPKKTKHTDKRSGTDAGTKNKGRPVSTKRAKEKARSAENALVTQSLLAGLSDSPGKSAATADQQDVTPKQISTSSASVTHSSDHQNAVDNQPAPASTTLSRHQQPNDLSARAKHTLNSSTSGSSQTHALSDDPVFPMTYDLDVGLTSHKNDYPCGATSSTDLQQVKLWMQDHFSQLTSMMKKNMDAVNNLRLALQKKKDRKVVGGEFETQASEDVLIVDKPQHHRGPDPLEVLCGNPGTALKCFVKLPNESALAEFHQLNACLPSEPHRYAQRMLSLFFSNEVLANSNCTPAKGRQLVDQKVMNAIKYQLNYKYPCESGEEERWARIVQKKLNGKCRNARKALKEKAIKEERNEETENKDPEDLD